MSSRSASRPPRSSACSRAFAAPAIAMAAAFATFAGSAIADLCVGPPAPLNSNASSDTGRDFAPEIATDRAGLWVAAWQSNGSLGGTVGTDLDVHWSFSANNGASWSAPAALNSNAATDTGADDAPRVASDGAGVWVAAWSSSDTMGGTIGSDRDVLVARWTGSGAWSTALPLNSNAGGDLGQDYAPDVAAHGGVWIAVWVSTENLGGMIGADEDILFARSTDAGATWSAPRILASDMASDMRIDAAPRVAADGQGRWVVAWQGTDPDAGPLGADADILLCRSTDGGSTWSAAAPLNSNAATDSGGDFDPHVQAGAGVWIAAWSTTEDVGGIGADDDVVFARSTNGGASWSSPAPISAHSFGDAGGDFGPRVATDGAEDWSVVWFSGDPLGDTIGFDLDILFANSTDGGANWSAAVPLDQGAATDSGIDGGASIATDGENRWIAAWHSDRDGGGVFGTDFDIWTARTPPSVVLPFAAIDFAAQGDVGGTWTGGTALGSATATVAAAGLCMNAPLEGDNIALWLSPEGWLPLVDGNVWRVRASATTSQAAADAIPFWQIVYDNFHSAGGGNNVGGEAWFLDGDGGAQGIGRAQGRDEFEVWIAPNAMRLPQWRGLVDPATSAFDAGVDAVNDLRIYFRTLDIGSAPLLADLDSGDVCIGSVRVDGYEYDSMVCADASYDPPIASTTHAAQTFAQASEGAGTATIDDGGARAIYRLAETGPGSRKTMLPAVAPFNLAGLYPVIWESNTLYRGELELASNAGGGAGPEGDDPVDVIALAFDTTNSELGQIHATTRGAPNNMRRAASPRLPATVGGAPQTYVGFFYSQNRTVSFTPQAARFRMLGDFVNTPEVGSEGVGGDEFLVSRMTVRKHGAVVEP